MNTVTGQAQCASGAYGPIDLGIGFPQRRTIAICGRTALLVDDWA
jgi:hypothetical protein